MNSKLIAVLKIRPFLFLFLAELFSQVAMNMVNFVLIIVVFKIANSSAAVSGVVLSYTVPAILFGMLAGVGVDRWNKKHILLWTNALRALLLLILVPFHGNLVIIYLLSFAIFTITQFFIPAETPMIPLLVRKELLLPANALLGMGVYGSILIAYALSGPALILLGERNVFVLLALMFFLAALFVSLIRHTYEPMHDETLKKGRSITGEMKEAFALMLKTKTIYHSLVLLAMSQLLILILAVIGPGYAKHILHIPIDTFPLLFVTPAAIGMIVGGIVIGNFNHAISKEKSATVGVFLCGLAMFLLPYGSRVTSREFVHTINSLLPTFLDITILHIMVFLAFILGFANALVFVPSNTIIQEKTTDAMRGKIYGGLNAVVGLLSLFPIIIVGELADLIGVARVITGIAICIFLVGIGRMLIPMR